MIFWLLFFYIIFVIVISRDLKNRGVIYYGYL